MTAFVFGVLLRQTMVTSPATAVASPAVASPAAMSSPVATPPGAATIVNSGSTNTAAYTLVIAPDGSATLAQDGAAQPEVVAAPQARWLFEKLHEAEPVDSLGSGHCMKSASFGTSTVVTWNGRSSSDLSCDDNPTSRELLRTIRVIARQLDIPTFRHRRRLLQP
jgi:hypothetical protein